MADLLGIAQFRLSDPVHFNRVKEALAAALQRTDSAQAWDRTDTAYIEETDTYLTRDGNNELVLVDPLAGTVKLSTIASGPGAPPTPPYLAGAFILNRSGLPFTPTVNRIYLVPCWADKALTVTGGRIYVASTGGANLYVGLYGTDGTKLAESASTSLSSTGWQNVSFSSGYGVSAGGQYYLAYQQNAAAGTLGPAPVYPSICKYVDTGWGLPSELEIPAGVMAHGIKAVGVMGVVTGGIY